MTTPHIHAEVIKAWADGATIEFCDKYSQNWRLVLQNRPNWNKEETYRVKPPEPKKVKMWQAVYQGRVGDTPRISTHFYCSEEEASRKFGSRFIQLLPHTEIEIEVAE